MRKIILILIFLLAFTLRFYQLGYNPPSLDWDEASLGYNAYSILKTGRDEYGNFLPLTIRSFNDYKPPLYTYLTTIPVFLFGLNEFSTRFISALFGTLAIVVAYFLIKELFPKFSSIYYLLFTILFTVSPWHIQFSRIAFEANIALTFFISGVLLFLKAILRQQSFIFYLLSFIFFAFSMYSYHSPRLIVPIFLVGLVIIFRKIIWIKKAPFLVALLAFLLLSLPILASLANSTKARFGSVTVLNPDERLGPSIKQIEFDQKRSDFLGKLMHNRRIVYAREVLGGYLDHFNFDFLFLTGDASARHHAASMGMLYLWELPFIFIGIFSLVKIRNKSLYLLLWWFLVAPISSSLTKATPHAVRSLLYLPTYQIFITFGLLEFRRFVNSRLISRFKRMTIFVAIFLLFVVNFYYYLHMYWIHTPVEESSQWQYGYKQLVEKVSKLEAGYSKVIVSYIYDQPYIYFLFYNLVDPSWYQKNWGSGEIIRAERKFGKYEFRNIDWEKDKSMRNVLLVGSPVEIPENAGGLLNEIYFLDGKVAFRIVGL